jgi:glucosyl-3-phosphoglycerate phosphatase
MTVFLVRHGEAEGNRERRFIGQQDVPLSDLGRRQADLAAHRLASSGATRVVASDLVRASATAQPLADLLGVRVEVDAALREVDNGAWTGLHAEEIEQGWPDLFSAYRAGDDVHRPGGERWEDVRSRVVPVVEDLLGASDPVAVFTHGGPVLCVALWVAGITGVGNIFTGPLVPTSNAAISRVVPGPRLVGYNDVGHLGGALDDDGQPSF